MSTDRLLHNVLQHYQDIHDDAKTEQIIGSTTHLLTELHNPLNLGLLTSHLLTAPALWQRPDTLATALRIISIYNTAAVRIHEKEGNGAVGCNAWTKAVVKGADDRSRRWQHLLVLTGVLMGMEGGERRSLSGSLRNTLEGAVVTATNLALEGHGVDGPGAAVSIVLGLNYAFPLLSPYHQTQINCNALLPIIIAAISGDEGLRYGKFLDGIARDTVVAGSSQLDWSSRSSSYIQLLQLDKRPLMNIMGPLSRLAAFAVQHATDSNSVIGVQDQILELSRRMLDSWSRNLLCQVGPQDEAVRLSPETLQTSWSMLWQVLKKALFGVVAVLQAIVSRSLLDPVLLNVRLASGIATKTLHTLRNLSFISSRHGNDAFQVYNFTYLTSIDVLSRDAVASEAFLRSARLHAPNHLPSTSFERSLDLFYLSLAEHLPLTLPTDVCEELIIKPAIAYLSHDGPMTAPSIELFETAHSAILSVLSCPQHSTLTIKMAPFYIVKLFESFPHHISPRQFRVAFKTVMQMVSPPFPIAAMEPHMSETLLEMLRYKATHASGQLLPATPDSASRAAASEESGQELLSEQNSLALALVDSLPFLPLDLLEEWLTVAAEVMNSIAEPQLREPVKKRFLEILVSGELDVERAAIGVAWWGTRGGQGLVLHGGARPQVAMMSGALGGEQHLSRL